MRVAMIAPPWIALPVKGYGGMLYMGGILSLRDLFCFYARYGYAVSLTEEDLLISGKFILDKQDNPINRKSVLYMASEKRHMLCSIVCDMVSETWWLLPAEGET